MHAYCRLQDSGALYKVPQGCLDDYFWMLASVSEQANCDRVDVSGALNEGKSRCPLVMTNDQIRDHQQFELLEPKLFNRWFSSTIVNYNFTGFVDNEGVDQDIFFKKADTWTKEIQKNESKLTKSPCWHFPVRDWDVCGWFCIRLPTSR